MQSHWDFLTEKLGKDVVRYIIQPMLMPSEESVRLAKAAVNDSIVFPYEYHVERAFPKQWRPSWVVWVTKRLEADRKERCARISRMKYDMMCRFWDTFGTSETFSIAHHLQFFGLTNE
jgi:hypothetical protein